MQKINIKQIKKEFENREALMQCATEFNMVGDPTRLKICYLLCRRKELSVGEIAEIIGVSVSAISHTLRKLRMAKLVKVRREAKRVFYRLHASRLTKYLKLYFVTCCGR